MLTRKNGTRNSITPVVRLCIFLFSSVASANAIPARNAPMIAATPT